MAKRDITIPMLREILNSLEELPKDRFAREMEIENLKVGYPGEAVDNLIYLLDRNKKPTIPKIDDSSYERYIIRQVKKGKSNGVPTRKIYMGIRNSEKLTNLSMNKLRDILHFLDKNRYVEFDDLTDRTFWIS